MEILTDKDHVNFLVQSLPMNKPKDIVQTIKSITAREIFTVHPEAKKKLLGGEFRSKGYYVNINYDEAIYKYIVKTVS